jgi:hypothetical protein
LFKGIAGELNNYLINSKVDFRCIELSASKPKVFTKYIYLIKYVLYGFIQILTVEEAINLLKAISVYIEFDLML